MASNYVAQNVVADEPQILQNQQVALFGVALNVASLTAIENMIAAPYSESTSYTVGQHCIHNHALYRCITATSGEQWTSEHWTQTTVMSSLLTIGG